jgi:hypothetical protein
LSGCCVGVESGWFYHRSGNEKLPAAVRMILSGSFLPIEISELSKKIVPPKKNLQSTLLWQGGGGNLALKRDGLTLT